MLLNIDVNSTTDPFLNSLENKENLCEADFYPFVDEFIDTNVTDILFNINGQSSATDTKYFDTFADKYFQKVENGVPVDYTDVSTVKAYYLAKYKYKVDPFAIWIKRTRVVGMNPWLSFRMNDCHLPDAETCWIRDSYFYEAQKKGLMNGEKYGYYRITYNYKYPTIREKFLGYIKEQLERYDVYGIELDFMREIYCFDYIDDDHDMCVRIMNDFMREVKKIVTEAEAVRGHKIKIAIRLTRDIEKSLRFGFDARTFAKEGLVDIIIPSPRFRGSDSAIPIDEWKRELPEVEIFGCIETLMNVLHSRHPVMSAETARGNAASFLAMGADDIYLYNLFGERRKARDKEIQCTVSDKHAEILKHPTRFVIIDEDDDICPFGCERWQQLPIIPEYEKTITIKTGNLPNDKTVRLILAFDEGAPEDADVSVNGKSVGKLSPCVSPEPEFSSYTDGAKCYDATVNLDSDTQNITIKKITDNKVVISWLELDVR